MWFLSMFLLSKISEIVKKKLFLVLLLYLSWYSDKLSLNLLFWNSSGHGTVFNSCSYQGPKFLCFGTALSRATYYPLRRSFCFHLQNWKNFKGPMQSKLWDCQFQLLLKLLIIKYIYIMASQQYFVLLPYNNWLKTLTFLFQHIWRHPKII